MGIKNSNLVAEHTNFNDFTFYGLLDVDFAWMVAMNFILFLKYLLTKTSKKQSCDVFGLFLLEEGCWDLSSSVKETGSNSIRATNMALSFALALASGSYQYKLVSIWWRG